MINRVPKVMLNYRPDGRRRLGRPLNRLLGEAETGLSSHNWLRTQTAKVPTDFSRYMNHENCCMERVSVPEGDIVISVAYVSHIRFL
jgi:hypothetical protein